MQQSVLLCISTILDSGNHYTKMMELTDDLGKKVFETISITLVRTTILCQNVSSTLWLWVVVPRCATSALRPTTLRSADISSPLCRAGSLRKRYYLSTRTLYC